MKRLTSRLIATTAALAAPLAFANPSELEISTYAGSELAPSPACLSAHADGSVFVGVDLLGSLGKGPNKGYIVKLIDSDNDGKADKHTRFANVDNPRGLIAMGNKVYVLHTVIPESTGILEAMHLSVFTDEDNDGIADGPPKNLITNISPPLHNQKRGADHTTNGIRMGIDGWIYIAVGDFGIYGAEGTDGTKLTQLGGGVLRVRPDGAEMEVYTHGLRNIYDVAIDPFMNIFTRGNTNDGGGWNIRFIHQIQSGEYGYPVLFKNFTNEIIPALVDLGGGSGTGALFMDEPTWPDKYNKVPMMADWGRNQIYIHRITPDGPSFTQKQENFIGTSQPADIDVDGSGRAFIAAWAGAGYKGNPKRGFIQIVTPKGWEYKPFPNLKKLDTAALVKGLRSDSSTARLNIQQEILRRADISSLEAIFAIAKDNTASLESRVAAIFTAKQLGGEKANSTLTELAKDEKVREWALRAIADRIPQNNSVSLEPFYKGLTDTNPRVQVAAATALGRIGKVEAAKELLSVAIPPKQVNSSAQATKEPLYTSKLVKGKDTIFIDEDINHIKSLFLIIEDGGDGTGNDHAAWCDPMLVEENGNKTPLSKLKWDSASQGWGKTLKNKNTLAKPLKRADGKPVTQSIGTHSVSVIKYTIPPKYVRFQATGSLTASSGGKGSVKFTLSPSPPASAASAEGPHATPNSPIILPHVAVQALVKLGAADACLAAIDTPSQDGALWALHLMHNTKVVDGLIKKLSTESDKETKNKILSTLARLYTKEAPYKGDWWWGTKPDTRGPYYVPITWDGSSSIEKVFRDTFASANADQKAYLISLANKNRMNLEGIGNVEKKAKSTVKKVGELSIEDVMLGLDKVKGKKANGKKLMATQACIACHSVKPGDRELGPSLQKIGSILNREAIAEAILKPDATIAENWVDVTLNDGTVTQGTLVSKSDTEVIVRNIAGIKSKLPMENVNKIAKSASTVMGPHLLDNLTMKEFADVIDYLHSLK